MVKYEKKAIELAFKIVNKQGYVNILDLYRLCKKKIGYPPSNPGISLFNDILHSDHFKFKDFDIRLRMPNFERNDHV